MWSLRPTNSRLLWLVVGVCAVTSAVAPADDPPPPCGPYKPSDYRLIAPTEVPWRYHAGVAIVEPGPEQFFDEPARLSTRIDALEGGHLRAGYAGSSLGSFAGQRHRTVVKVRFLPGDTGARVTVTYYEDIRSDDKEGARCLRTLTADIRALPDEGVRVRVGRIRQRGRRLIVTGRLSRPARRPILVLVTATAGDRGGREMSKRVRTRGRRFRTTFSLRRYDRFNLPLRRIEARGFHPGDFWDPVPLDQAAIAAWRNTP